MSIDLVRQWARSTAPHLPLPGAGDTLTRWQALADLAETDLVAGRLGEAHADACAILAELGGPAVRPGELWGVWAAEAPGAVLQARRVEDAVVLDGARAWCSGAGVCTHALVTARTAGDPEGPRGLFAVALGDRGVVRGDNTWYNAGMAAADTRAVDFVATPGIPVGAPGAYLDRPGFWHGAIAVSACWWGGARAVAEPLYAAGRSGDPHNLAHLGAVDAALSAAAATLAWAATEVDADPQNRSGTAELIARRARAVVEHAVDEAIRRTGRALGPAPLVHDARHARYVADLEIYVRQSHAERDLCVLGRLAAERR
ncbi:MULTISPECIES: acyl-CoA dehydrogenase [Mycobacteriaceae]|uniref:acyl-CoA dehydrogenase n=1 Tax=Mycobacteriaceae TaxID=1762 RepID=UPI0007FD989F|nr:MULTISPECIES: acyl-CoA dehydrogenase [Mycobacteriaceae]MCK0175797.1 acyl-CoA dehydrogenase family protein [Mycolicibacterium sp. F2034L]OBB60123.1 acyl-CoA dehydrogenase [Mycobacterium sp. 852013-51886_SCH5428379]